MVRSYFRIGSDDQDKYEKLATLFQAGVGSGSIFFDSDQSNSELRRVLNLLRSGDTFLVLQLSDVCRSIATVLDIFVRLRERNVRLRSLGEPWFDISDTTLQGSVVCDLLGWMANLERTRPSTEEPLQRPVGRPPGTYKQTLAKVDAAITLYAGDNRMTVAEICSSVGLNARTFYRYLSDRKPNETTRRPRGRKGLRCMND